MDVNVKDLNKFIGSDGLTVLNEVRVSTTEPAFRENGYETNGDKKSFALGFDSTNQEHIELEDTITLSQDGDFVEATIEGLATTNIPIISDSLGNSVVNFFTNYVSVIDDSSNNYDLTGGLLSSISYNISDKNTFKIHRTGGNYEVSMNGTVLKTNTALDNFVFDRVLRNNNSYGSAIIYKMVAHDCNYQLKRGLGVDIIGSNVKRAEIKTSAANPQQRVNFGMWLKGDDVNGWNPYTV